MTDAQHQDPKRYGIRIRMSDMHPLALPHLLGDAWETTKWFDSEAERDRIYAALCRRIPYYRRGDEPARQVDKIEG